MEFRKAMAELRALWVVGNEYLQAAEPWVVFKEDPARAAAILRFALNLVRLYAIVSAPVLPFTAAKLRDALALGDAPWPGDAAEALAALPAGHAFAVPENLFEKITDEQRAAWAARFAGQGTAERAGA